MIKSQKVYNTLRSLYRYSELKEMDAPEILLDTEKSILIKRMSNLEPDEILYLAENFLNYKKDQKIREQIDLASLSALVNKDVQ